ncbi:hypothetical protein ACIQJX_28045 [Streptomyces griseoviridis]|uniref:hypothetical protein n=1 Tax=Streptomyces griseoviridis TaxID=45398 RepID=UPI003422FC22
MPTCIPGDEAQHRLIAELSRILKSGGILYISDLLLQDDERNRNRNRSRYDRHADHYGSYGVFETGDGAVCRHHPREWFSTLLAGFQTIRHPDHHGCHHERSRVNRDPDPRPQAHIGMSAAQVHRF